jgi:hypothetical protein
MGKEEEKMGKQERVVWSEVGHGCVDTTGASRGVGVGLISRENAVLREPGYLGELCAILWAYVQWFS